MSPETTGTNHQYAEVLGRRARRELHWMTGPIEADPPHGDMWDPPRDDAYAWGEAARVLRAQELRLCEVHSLAVQAAETMPDGVPGGAELRQAIDAVLRPLTQVRANLLTALRAIGEAP